MGNIAGSSLEQTSWLSRNLEVKAQPQISLEESDAEEDLHGRCRRARKSCLLPASRPSFPLQVNCSHFFQCVVCKETGFHYECPKRQAAVLTLMS